MYSPKIKEEFIPPIYRIARNKGTRMTTLVNEIIEKAIREIGDPGEETGKNKSKKGDKNEASRTGQGTGKTETSEMGQEGSFNGFGYGFRRK